jgi:hypothetical protein
MLLRTLARTGSMAPVVSARNTMSGFGATAGVFTVAAKDELSPGARVSSTAPGSTPGAA